MHPVLPMTQSHEPSSGILQEGRFTVTPDIAQQVLDKFNYQNQRPVLRLHVARLASLMESGAWLQGTQIAFAMMPDQTVHLINGQHRLHAVIQSGVTIEAQVLLVPVRDLDECHAAYYRFDTVQRARSTATIAGSSGIAERLGIRRMYVTQAITAGVLIKLGLCDTQGQLRDPILSTPDGQMAAIEPWWPYVKIYSDIKTDTYAIQRKMLNAGSMAVALVTLKYQPERALEFWTGVGADDGLSNRDPRKTLLKDWQARGAVKNLNAGMSVVANAWNAFYRGHDLHHIKVIPDAPVVVRGTPFNGVAK